MHDEDFYNFLKFISIVASDVVTKHVAEVGKLLWRRV